MLRAPGINLAWIAANIIGPRNLERVFEWFRSSGRAVAYSNASRRLLWLAQRVIYDRVRRRISAPIDWDKLMLAGTRTWD